MHMYPYVCVGVLQPYDRKLRLMPTLTLPLTLNRIPNPEPETRNANLKPTPNTKLDPDPCTPRFATHTQHTKLALVSLCV